MTVRELVEVLNNYPEDFTVSMQKAGEVGELEEVEIQHFSEHITLITS